MEEPAHQLRVPRSFRSARPEAMSSRPSSSLARTPFCAPRMISAYPLQLLGRRPFHELAAEADPFLGGCRSPPDVPAPPEQYLAEEPGTEALCPLLRLSPEDLRLGAVTEPAVEVPDHPQRPDCSFLVAEALQRGESFLGERERIAHGQGRVDLDLGLGVCKLEARQQPLVVRRARLGGELIA